jgi:asparagine synthetase B (glutamine-hydrolysing)
LCGLLAFSFKQGRLSSSRRAVLATSLSILNDQRGGHSWGTLKINNDNTYKVARGLGHLALNAHHLCDYNMLFAHTRYATQGEPSIKNAHPFKIGNIIGAHNGMIYNHEELCKKYDRDFSVDSMHIFAHLNEKRPFDDMIGYGAIQWIKKHDPKTIYCSRLHSGELSIYGIGKHRDPDGIVLSSSAVHLEKALTAAGLTEFFPYQVRTGKVYAITDGQLYVVPNMKLNLTAQPEPTEEEIMAAFNIEIGTEIEKNSVIVHPLNRLSHLYSGKKIDQAKLYNAVYGA